MNYIETFNYFKKHLLSATMETLSMVFIACLIGLALAIPTAIFLYETKYTQHKLIRVLNYLLSAIVNTIRSIPFLIFIVVVMPLSFYLMGTSFGSKASIVPLSFISFALSTKATEQSLQTLNPNLGKTAEILGANKYQTYRMFYLVEMRPHWILGITSMIISMISYSSVMGTIAGGGLGDLAIRYGYQEYHPKLLVIVLFMMFIMVQIVQQTGGLLSSYYDKTKKKRGIK